jgi:tetratricopeptide (TPR) repeat protein
MTEPSLPEESLFAQALEIASAAERAAFLDRACGNNRALRAEVEALLRAHERSGDLLDLPEPSPAPTDLPGREVPGTVLGPYKLLEPIGEGGMGTVWMAEQTDPIQRRVAVKVVKEGMDSRQVLVRFEAERQALALMEHPNIARVLDAGKTPSGRPFFVMELVKGQPITAYCDEKRLPVRERLELFGDVCRAVQHAHQKGIIHRDLKPSNVLVAPYDGKPVVKVIDFGVAKATGQRLTDKTLFTGFGALVGTPEYMSPEQAETNNQDIDTRSDIYSLGVVLYELLTGTTPLTRKRIKEATLLEVLRAIREEEPPRPSTRLAESKDTLPSLSAQRQTEPAKLASLVRGELDWIVMRALEKDRNRRYETASNLGLDIQRYLADEPVLACPPSAWYRFGKFARRNKVRLAIGTCVFVAVALIACAIGWAVADRAARAEEGERAEKVRLATVEGQVRESVNVGRTLVRENNLPGARQKFAEARAQLGNDRTALSTLASEVEACAASLNRFQQFLALIEQAHQAETAPFLTPALAADAARAEAGTPPVAPGRRPAAAVPLLLKALAEYAILERSDWTTTLEDGLLGKSQIDLIRHTAYEELLWLANDILRRQVEHPSGHKLSAAEAGQAALGYLAQAEKARRPTRALYALRAGCRKAMGDEEAFQAAQQLVETTAPTIALDHFLQGLAACDAKQPTQAIAAFDAALTVEPTHYWSMMYLGFCLTVVARTPAEYAGAARVFTGCIMKRPDHHYPYMFRALIYAKQGRYQEALADSSRAVDLQPEDAKAWANRGTRYRELQQPDKAIADFSRAIECDATFAPIWNDRGATYLDTGQLDKALADLTKAVQLDATLVFAWHNRGILYAKLGQPAKAIDDYSQAIKLDPTFAASWINRGIMYASLGQNDKAIADYTEVVKLDGNSAIAYFNRGIAYAELGQYEQALKEQSKAVELNPKYKKAWYERGLANWKLRRFKEAVADFSQAIDLDLNNAQYWYNRGNAYADLGQPEKAVADCTQAIKLAPQDAVAWSNRGAAYMSLWQLENAEADLSQALKLDEKLAVAWFNRGTCYYNLKQPEKAIIDLSQALKLDEKLAGAWLTRAAVYTELKQVDKAIADYTQAIKWDDKLTRAWFNRACLYYARNQRDKAIDDFSQVVKLDEKHARAWYNRGVIYSELHQPEKAIDDFSQAIKADKHFALAWYNRGVIYERQGRFEKAIADLSRFLDVAPDHPQRPEAYMRRALCHRDLGHDEDALKDFLTVEKMVPPSAMLQNELALLLANSAELKLRDPKLAVEKAKKAVDLAPKEGKYRNTLGVALYRAGGWKDAVAALDKSVELRQGGDPADWLFLAMAHYKLGNEDAARKQYDRAVEWLDKNAPALAKDPKQAELFRRFRGEAEEVLELKKK